jgi:hypothetical protein
MDHLSPNPRDQGQNHAVNFQHGTRSIRLNSSRRHEKERKHYEICLTFFVITLFLQAAISVTVTALAAAEKGNGIPAAVLSGLNVGLSMIITWMKSNKMPEKESIRASKFQNVIDFIDSTTDLLNSENPQPEESIHLLILRAQQMFDEANVFMAESQTTFLYWISRQGAYSAVASESDAVESA